MRKVNESCHHIVPRSSLQEQCKFLVTFFNVLVYLLNVPESTTWAPGGDGQVHIDRPVTVGWPGHSVASRSPTETRDGTVSELSSLCRVRSGWTPSAE